ncbi:dTDP-4-dehydrorhamnose reductase [Pectinatus brassicae]|uniref:dTDP-4-dehydrorhamnose reductase n=1 Tax=Pectinatus brassicae TaxID=862415 RepID=A0A840UGB1_9FIRM|nr:dTDP-4-dehydrorhamnose reductase [Pectinatus brassicae]MBB5336791.1 dTDP-4-dehydrorhamnose reductase [Pectinatus brassicae]
MKILVTGCSGQLGFDVCRELDRRNIAYYGAVRSDFDLTDKKAIQQFIEGYKPEVVIHCAAYTAVDKAEDEVDLCRKINVDAVKAIADGCKLIDAKLIYISTDYVFPGDGEKFYNIDDEKNPPNVYGKSKLDGEEIVKDLLEKYFIVRISWVFGINGHNFIKTMLKLADSHADLKVVDDQIGSPTYTADLAPLLCDMAQSEKYGTYHATNEGICSWAQFAAEIFKLAGKNVEVTGQPSEAYPTKAKRPLNSRLSKKSLDEAGFKRLPDWHDALDRYIKELNG